jgi:hypothetical protein
MGKRLDKFMERLNYISKDVVRNSQNNTHGTYSIMVQQGTPQWELNKALVEKYPNLTNYLGWVATESPTVRSQLQKGQVSSALLSTMETIQSAYVAPSVSGIGPAKQMLTEWWFNPIWGQPRLVDIRTVKQLARGHIGSMAVEAILDQIMQVDWDIIPKYQHQVDRPPQARVLERQQKIQVQNFLEDPNRNHQSFDSILRMYLRNILETDDGVLVKVFQDYERPDQPNLQQASTGDIRAYTAQPAWDQVPVPGSPLVEVYAEDGTSFLKQVDMHGYLMNYWQYSFVVPRRPIRFETSEIIYTMQNPRAGSPYGYSPFESVVDALLFLDKGFRYNEHFYENSAIPALQIDYPWIKNKEELEEVGKYIENTFMGPDKSFRTLVTNGGTVVKALNIDPAKLQMLEMQDFYMRLVLAKLKVPPIILGLTGGPTGTGGGMGMSADMQNSVHKSRAIKPLMVLGQEALTAQLLPDILGVSPQQCLIQFAWTEITDIAELERQAHVDQVYLATGKTTVNECRLRDGEDPVPWGNKPFIPAMGLLGGDSPQDIGFFPGVGGKGGGGAGGTGGSPFPSAGGAGGGGPKSEQGKAASGAKTANQYGGYTPQDQMPRSIAPRPSEGSRQLAGAEFKDIDHTSLAISRGLRDILSEAYDRLQDHENFDKMLPELIDKANTVITYHIPTNATGAEKAKEAALKNFKEILSNMAVDFRDGRLH